MTTVTINRVTTSMIFLYPITPNYTLDIFDIETVTAIQASCHIHRSKLHVGFSAIVEGWDAPVPVPGIVAPPINPAGDLGDIEDELHELVYDALLPHRGKKGKPSAVLEHSFSCALITLDVPEERAGRKGVQLYAWCFFDPDGSGYLISYHLHIGGNPCGELERFHIEAHWMGFAMLQDAVLRQGKLITRKSKGFAERVQATIPKQILFPGRGGGRHERH